MRKTFLKALIILISILLLTGCGDVESLSSSVQSFIKGDVTGELNTTYSTQWFDFNVKDIRASDEYGGYPAYDGYKYVIATVEETNTFDESIPMGASDFYVSADGLEEEDTYPYESFDDKMMPDEFQLDVGETVEYDVVFEIPEEIVDIRFIYIEVDDTDHVGATFTINHTLSLSIDKLT